MKIRVLVAAAAGLFLSVPAIAAEIKVLAVGPVKEVYLDEIIPQFEKKSGHTVSTTWSGTADIKKRLAAGEVYDVVIVSGPDIDAFIKQGNMVAGSRIDLMKSGIGVGIRAGARKPDIGSSEALKQMILTAKSLAIQPDQVVTTWQPCSTGWALLMWSNPRLNKRLPACGSVRSSQTVKPKSAFIKLAR